MDRNLLLATVFSIVAVFAYYLIFPPPEPVPQPETPESQISSSQSEARPENAAIKNTDAVDANFKELSKSGARRKLIKVETDLYSAEIDTREGILRNFWLKNYKYYYKPHFNVKNYVFALFTGGKEEEAEYDPDRMVNMAGDVSDKNLIWRVSAGADKSPVDFLPSAELVETRGKAEKLVLKALLPSGLEQYKTFTFYPDSYLLDMEVRIVNKTGRTFELSPKINFGAGGEAIKDEPLPKPKNGAVFADDDLETFDGDDLEGGMNIRNSDWAGVMDTYFVAAVKSLDNLPFNGKMSPLSSSFSGSNIFVPKLEYTDSSFSLASGTQYVKKFQLFMGPKLHSEMDKFDLRLSLTMDLGWFDFLAYPLLAVLRWLQSYAVNWGLAIILLTIIVRVSMFPIAYKGLVSMRKMSQLGPQIKIIREKYKDDKERINKEIMNFYSRNKVNPLGGCLPMLIQIPIFIALYQALLPAIELRHTPFIFWMDDLSAADYTLILPILMGVSMFIQQSLSPSPGMDATQAKIMKWLPVLMVLFFLSMPSGLVLYWVISNILSIFQQLIFNKRMPLDPAAIPDPIKSKPKKTKKSGKKRK